MPTPVLMPQMGESIAEGTIVRWIKKVGDTVDRDEPLFEISTDKVDAEIPAPAAGVLTEIKVKEGETVAVNSVVATIGTSSEVSEQEPLRVPSSDWRRVRDASVLGKGMRDGRAVWRVSFYDPTVPAWFEVELDRRTHLPLRLRMTAAAHFMTHTFRGFNAPLSILPPV